MKSTGVIRKLDSLGRIVIPKEIRNTRSIDEGDAIEIFVDGEKIILRKYKVNTACFITGEVTDENIQYAEGLYLSPRGAQILKERIEDNE